MNPPLESKAIGSYLGLVVLFTAGPFLFLTQIEATMADNGIGFDLDKFTHQWNQMNATRDARQNEEVKQLQVQQQTNEALAGIQEQSLSAKQEYLDQSVRPAVKEMQSLTQAEQKQHELMKSGNFLDYLKIMDMQMTNPRMYTSEGRSKVRAEINARMAMGATLNAATQEVLQAQMDQVKNQAALKQAKLQSLTLQEKQAAEVIKSEVDRVQMIRQGLAESNAAKAEILDGMTVDQMKAARDAAVQKKESQVDISGFKIDLPQIDMQIQKAEQLTYDMQVKRLTAEKQLDELNTQSNRKILNSLSKNQITALATGNPIEITTSTGKMALTPQDFKPEDLKQAYDFKGKIENDEIDRVMKQQMSADIVDSTLRPQLEQMERIKANKSIPDNSPVKQRAKERSSTMTQVIEQLNKLKTMADADPQNQAMQDMYKEAVFQTQQRFQKEAETDSTIFQRQAKQDSRGDNKLYDLLMDNYRGDPVDTANATNAVVDRLVKGASSEDILPKDVAQNATRIYREKYNAMLKDQQYSIGDSISKGDMQKQAAQEALQVAVTQHIQSKTDEFLGNQSMLDPKAGMWSQNPIASVADAAGRKLFPDPASFLMFMKNADNEGERMFQQTQQWLTPAHVQMLQNGQSVVDGSNAMTPQEYQQGVLKYQNIQLLMNLDMKRPGLADQYVAWWADNGQAYAKANADSLMSTAAAGDLQNNVITTMGSSLLDRSIQTYQYSVIDSLDAFKQERTRQRKDWVSYDLDPANRQAALLQFDPSLSDDDKTRIYRGIIQPVLAKAKQAGLEYDEANIAVEEAIANPQTIIPNLNDDPALKKALNKMSISRGEISKTLEALTDSPWLYGNDKQVPASIWDRISKENTSSYIPPGDIQSESVRVKQIRRPFISLDGNAAWLNNETQTRPYDWFRKVQAPQAK